MPAISIGGGGGGKGAFTRIIWKRACGGSWGGGKTKAFEQQARRLGGENRFMKSVPFRIEIGTAG